MFVYGKHLFGGYTGNSLKNCYKYDTKRSKWKVTAIMNACRENAACTVFRGKIVLTGGYDGVNRISLSSVEVYGYYENNWDFLPRMINKRLDHEAGGMGNNLFVIGGFYNATCEVFDSSSM